MDFEDWMIEVDKICIKETKCSIYDLPDMMYRDAFDDGVTPQEFFDNEIASEVEDMVGYYDFFEGGWQ